MSIVTSSIEKEANAVLEKLIAADSYLLFVEPELKAINLDGYPYVPDDLVLDRVGSSWRNWVSKVQLEVQIDKRYRKSIRSKIEAILIRKLGLQASRGDAVRFQELDIERPKDSNQLEVELLRSDSAARDARLQLERISKERETDRTEVQRLKLELENVAKAKKEPAAVVKETPKGFFESNAANILGASAGIFILGLLIIGFFVRQGSRTLSEGFGPLATDCLCLARESQDHLPSDRPSSNSSKFPVRFAISQIHSPSAKYRQASWNSYTA